MGINTWKKAASIMFVQLATIINRLRSCNLEILKYRTSSPGRPYSKVTQEPSLNSEK